MEILFQHPLFKPLVLTAVLICAFPLLAGYIVLLERKLLGDFQVRLGPMRVGPHGLLQPLADAVKLLTKEDTIPEDSDKTMFWLGPVISTFTALTSFCVLPFSSLVHVADVNVGLLVISAMSGVGIIGIILGGWSSNSHYPLLGSLRSAAQLVSYEVALGLALISGVMMAGTLSLVEIVEAQRSVPFALLQPLGFVIFLIAGIAETNRIPFDLPEAEGELGAGYHTEYSAMGFGIFQLAEYAAIWTISALAATLFLGGWQGPGAGTVAGLSLLYFFAKSILFVLMFYWLRGTLPRLRYDQLMAFGWKVLLPLSLLNLLWVAAVTAWRAQA